MVNTFPAEERTIKNNILFVETTQTEKKINANLRIIRIKIKRMQVPNDSSDKKWNNNLKIYLNPERAEAGITAARVKSARKKDSEILLLSAMRIMKKKIKFEKRMTVPKTSRFNKYIQRAIEEDLLEARKPDSYIVTFPNSIPIIILKLKIKKTVASILPKGIYSNLLINSNKRVPVKAYAIIPRKFKNKIKVRLNTEKLLTIIISTQVKGVTVRDLIANYPHVYRTFFGRATSENRKEKKDSIIINSMRTGVSVKIAFFRENPVTFRTLSKVIITLDDSVELRGLINLGAEINCIDKVTYEQLIGVVIIPSLNMEIVSHSNHRVPFIGVYKNVRLAVKLIKYEICLFIIDVKTSYSLILGALFIFQSNLSLGTEKDTGRQFSTVKDIDRRLTARFYTGSSNNAGRRRVKAGTFDFLNL
jgi:hypothetical protein